MNTSTTAQGGNCWVSVNPVTLSDLSTGPLVPQFPHLCREQKSIISSWPAQPCPWLSVRGPRSRVLTLFDPRSPTCPLVSRGSPAARPRRVPLQVSPAQSLPGLTLSTEVDPGVHDSGSHGSAAPLPSPLPAPSHAFPGDPTVPCEGQTASGRKASAAGPCRGISGLEVPDI